MVGNEEKPSETVRKSLLSDMTHVRDQDNHKVVAAAFDMEETWDQLLDEREFKECDFARKYALDYAHGTAGHNRLMLISKLCEIIDVYEEALNRMIRIADTGQTG